MTAATVELCGHRWHTAHGCAALPEAGVWGRHHCGHRWRQPLPMPPPPPIPADRPRPCRCGATTTRKDER